MYMVITRVLVVHKLKMNVLEMGNEGYGASGDLVYKREPVILN